MFPEQQRITQQINFTAAPPRMPAATSGSWAGPAIPITRFRVRLISTSRPTGHRLSRSSLPACLPARAYFGGREVINV